jgi:DME family drug/metabolite transporter
LFVWGLSYTTATDAAILMPAVPVFAVALAVALGVERVGPRRIAGVALAVAGALVVLDPSRFSLADRAAVGDLLILVNCLLYAGYLVLQRPVLERLPWRTVLAWSYLFGSLGVLAVGGAELAALEPAAVSRGAWLGVAFILLFPTVLGYLLATWAVRRSSPTLVAAYTTLQPLLSALLAATFLGERIGAAEAAGFALIAAGLWLVSRRRRVRAG